MLILTYFFILKKTSFLTLYFHVLSSIKRNVRWPCCWILLSSTRRESPVNPCLCRGVGRQFWAQATNTSLAENQSCLRSSHRKCDELCPQLCTPVLDTIQVENWSTEWFFWAGDGKLTPCSDTGLEIECRSLASVGRRTEWKWSSLITVLKTAYFPTVLAGFRQEFPRKFSVVRSSFPRPLR